MNSTPLDRDQFPVSERYLYLNHAGVSPLPRCARSAMLQVIDDFTENGAVNLESWEVHQEEVRARLAALVGCSLGEIAFVKNTTEGLGFVANGLTWKPGDRVVVPDLEFPSTIYPWLSLRDLGVEVDLVQPVGAGGALPLEAFRDVLEANEGRGGTRLVAASWVQYARGYRLDPAGLADLCHSYGALLCLDVIQGAGAIPLDLSGWGVDFAMADSHKWMLGPVGVGFLFAAERCLDLLRPLEPGWASVVHREEWDNLDLTYDDNARRFEGGTYDTVGIAGMGASVEMLLEAGVDQVWSHIQQLTEQLTDGLGEKGAVIMSDKSSGPSGIVTFAVPGRESESLVDDLAQDGISVSFRGGGVRVAPHGYNTADEIARFLSAIPNATTVG